MLTMLEMDGCDGVVEASAAICGGDRRRKAKAQVGCERIGQGRASCAMKCDNCQKRGVRGAAKRRFRRERKWLAGWSVLLLAAGCC